MKAQEILKRPYVDLPYLCMNLKNAQEIEKDLDAIAERAACMAAYIAEACGTYGCGSRSHEDSLKALNKRMKAVRKALGYNVTHTLSF